LSGIDNRSDYDAGMDVDTRSVIDGAILVSHRASVSGPPSPKHNPTVRRACRAESVKQQNR
jgi:hypothetical protein